MAGGIAAGGAMTLAALALAAGLTDPGPHSPPSWPAADNADTRHASATPSTSDRRVPPVNSAPTSGDTARTSTTATSASRRGQPPTDRSGQTDQSGQADDRTTRKARPRW